MGADHEADPAGPDQTSHDHADGQTFNVWTTRDQGSGSAPPARAAHEPPDAPAPPVEGSYDRASHEPESGSALPTRTPAEWGPGTALPKRVSGDGALPTRTPFDSRPGPGTALPKRVPGDGALPTRTPAESGSGPGTAFPKRVPGDGALPTRTQNQADGPGDPAQPAQPAQSPAEPGTRPVFPKRVPGANSPTRSLVQPPAQAPMEGDPNILARTLQGLGGTAPAPVQAPQADASGPPGLPARAPRGPGDGSALPVRTTRYRRPGRHSSPHLLSLPSDTPALVIAVPGSARPESEDIAIRVAEAAGTSCHGADIRIGFLRGNQDLLADVLDELATPNGGPAAVVVPLLAFPNPEADAAIAETVAEARAPFLIAGHLGPHPLLAEAVHARLADAGLARASRVGRISIVTGADGIIVGAAGNDEALEGAGVVAVLLASRLTMPVAAASLSDPGSIKDAANRLREARVARIALAPCMIGPELTSGTLDAIATLTSTDYAPPLGSHPAVAQLVAIRYGAALADPQVASMMAEVRGEAVSSSARASGGASEAAAPPPAPAQ